jgi:hypothetical protein
MPSGIGTAGAGAELTSGQVARILVNPLQARSVVLAAGPRVFDSQGDPPDEWRRRHRRGPPTGPGTTFRLLGVPVRSPPRCPAPGLAASSSWPT